MLGIPDSISFCHRESSVIVHHWTCFPNIGGADGIDATSYEHDFGANNAGKSYQVTVVGVKYDAMVLKLEDIFTDALG